jgi:hypothetical protein
MSSQICLRLVVVILVHGSKCTCSTRAGRKLGKDKAGGFELLVAMTASCLFHQGNMVLVWVS